MKLSVVPSIIAFAISSLIAYGLYNLCQDADMKLLLSIFGGCSMLLTFWGTLAISFEESRTTVNIRVLSGVFALLMVVSNAVFCCVSSFTAPLYIIINGILILVWLMSVYGIKGGNK